MPYEEISTTAQNLFLRGMGIIYLTAFASLAIQVKGLYGSQGIQPLKHLLNNKTSSLFFKFPSIFWFQNGDTSLIAACYLGIISSVFVIVGYGTPIFLFILWALYLSFVSVGYPFLNFQWDALLLETGFISIFYSILNPTPPLFTWVLWLLLFRFMFASGFTKLVQGSDHWRNLTAIDYHYQTQPIPNTLSYYFHQQPKWFSKFTTLGVHAIELLVPFLIFTPEPLRIYAFWVLTLFQCVIIATGNFAFFNLLTIVLCLPLLSRLDTGSILIQGTALEVLLTIIAGILIFLNGCALVVNLYPQKDLNKFVHFFSRYYIINTYGLFVNMTTVRNEIIVEGSNDQKEWKPYEFHWKPGDIKHRPKQVAPHQPRLDWQMWFAALSHIEHNSWFSHFLYCLLDNAPEVLKLLKHNPFPTQPPKYIRATLYRYRFTSLEEKKKSGNWWKRTYLDNYTRIIYSKN